VTVLDFACGTGTFLLEVFQRIFDNIGGPGSGRADPIVREHMLKNLFGFEYLIAPYTIAHLKLSQYLRDQGHQLNDDERLQVFLTNTLEPIEPQKNLLLPAVTAEVEAAQKVKDRDILVITGNPPYAGHSKNKGKWIKAEIEAYKRVDGKPLPEKNPKWLQDDYVKFIRFAQIKMDAANEGVVGIITNHSYLDNPTFRGMRQSLASTFDQIFILDLHGSTKPKERVPAGSENENVFDIQKGVAIALFVKKQGAPRGVWYSDFWGTRLSKYQAAAGSEFGSIDWRPVPFFEPYYMFVPLDWSGWESYERGWSVADSLRPDGEKVQLFHVNVLGFQTHRDDFAIAAERSEIEARVRDMLGTSISDRELKEKYELRETSDWKIKDARAALRKRSDPNYNIIQCAYRPFDDPYCFFGVEFMDRVRRELTDHVAHRDNIQLVASRQIGTADWRHAFVAAAPANDCLISDESSEANQVFPLLRFTGDNPIENLSSPFRAFLDARYENHYTAEEILGFIYGVLHAPAYRSRYAEFLRIDFPRISFPEKAEDFETLSKFGWALVQAHLLRELPRRSLANYHGKGDHTVEAVRYSPEEKAIRINKTQFFKPVPQEVWDFRIGGYQVLDKYLKARKGRVLSLDEINHVASVADALAFTIEQMARIDKAYKAAFPDRG
jgi:predicted helicase